MVNRIIIDLRETLGLILCVLLSLLAFLGILVFVSYNYADRWVALLGLMISLACPVVWLALLLWKDGGGGGLLQRVKSNVKLPRLAVRRMEQPTGALAKGPAVLRLLPQSRER